MKEEVGPIARRRSLIDDARTTINHALEALERAKDPRHVRAEVKEELDEAIGWLEAAAKELSVIRKGVKT